jgi:hypothetical protein
VTVPARLLTWHSNIGTVGSTLQVGSACVTLVPLCLPILSAGPTLYSIRAPTMRPLCTKAVIALMQRLGVAQGLTLTQVALFTFTCTAEQNTAKFS